MSDKLMHVGPQAFASHETAASATAALAQATIQARHIMAMQRPRNIDAVRLEMLRECDRPQFAEVARYRKPVGQGVEGLSIRFVEQMLQVMGNCSSEAVAIYNDEKVRILEVRVTDYEKNVVHQKQITVTKTVERANPEGRVVVGERLNSKKKTVYIVEATDEEILDKEAAMISKALRTCGLRLIPGWLAEECEERIKRTNANRAAKDPDAERKKMVDAFSEFGAMPDEIAEYLGKDLARMSPTDHDHMRAVFNAIRAGETTWEATLEHRREERSTSKPETEGSDRLSRYLAMAKPVHDALRSASCGLPAADAHMLQLAAMREECGLARDARDEIADGLYEQIRHAWEREQ